MNRQFVLRDRAHIETMLAFIRQNWRAMSEAGKPLAATLAPYSKPRSSEQNALMWVWLAVIAEHAWTAGRRFDADTWHEHMKREHLPERTAKGKEKWRILPTGERVLALSTTDLSTAEMSDYMNRLEAYAVTELGVPGELLAPIYQ